MSSCAPIGVFDSGLGGISVVRELREAMPNERIIYFGDSANAPYGIKKLRKKCVSLVLRLLSILQVLMLKLLLLLAILPLLLLLKICVSTIVCRLLAWNLLLSLLAI